MKYRIVEYRPGLYAIQRKEGWMFPVVRYFNLKWHWWNDEQFVLFPDCLSSDLEKVKSIYKDSFTIPRAKKNEKVKGYPKEVKWIES